MLSGAGFLKKIGSGRLPLDNSGVKPPFTVGVSCLQPCMERFVLLVFNLTMRGATLFFATIMVITPGGRGALEAYVGVTITQFAEQSPYSYIYLGFMALLALVLLVAVHRQRPEKPTVFIVVREIQGPMYNTETPRVRIARRPAGGLRMERLFAFFRRFRWAL